MKRRKNRGWSWQKGWEEGDEQEEPNTIPANAPKPLFWGSRPYRRLWDFFFISFQHRFMTGGSRILAAPTDPLNSFGLRQGTPAPSWGGAGVVAAALTCIETQTPLQSLECATPSSAPSQAWEKCERDRGVGRGEGAGSRMYLSGWEKERLCGSVHGKVLSYCCAVLSYAQLFVTPWSVAHTHGLNTHVKHFELWF